MTNEFFVLLQNFHYLKVKKERFIFENFPHFSYTCDIIIYTTLREKISFFDLIKRNTSNMII